MAISVNVKVSQSPDYVDLNGTDFETAYDRFDSSLCVADTDKMKYKPIRLKFYHFDRQSSLRKILWHEDDLITEVCVQKELLHD